jgi:hypothetical protein
MRAPRALGLISTLVFAACDADVDRADGRSESAVTGSALDAVIADRISVEEDRTLYTLFAMLNAAGYDEENNVEMHPVRRAVRGALPRRLPDTVFTQLDAFYTRVGGRADVGGYAMAAKATSGPPDFAPLFDWADGTVAAERFATAPQPISHVLAALSGLPALLRAFHATFPVDSVYRTHAAMYRGYVDEYRALIRQKASMVFAYTRMRDPSELAGRGENRRVKVIPSLLLSHFRDFSFDLDGVRYRVEGPRRELMYDGHDFITAVTRPISHDSARYGTLHRAAARAYALARPGKWLTVPFAEYADEGLALAIGLRLAILTSPADSTRIRQNWRTGDNWLAPYFVEQLEAYERQRGSLRDYYPRLFDALEGWRDSAIRVTPR